jgi:hypothetical protein
MADDDDDVGATKKGMDPLKAYCLVLGFLVIVLGVLWIKIGGDREDYEAANARAEQLLTGKGLVRQQDGPPVAIPALAYEVEQYVETYKASAGEGGGDVSGIPLEMMRLHATNAGMKQIYVGSGQIDPHKAAGYETRSNDFEYDPTTIRNLMALVFNVENRGRYRVSEIAWKLQEPKDNPAPHWHIAKPKIKVAVRTPIQRER